MRDAVVEIIGGLIICVVIIVPFVWFSAYNEAKSYRKFCGTDVTTWDAIWLDLRIDECTRRDK